MLNEKQIHAIRCAYLDMVGAIECVAQGDPQGHDWKAHALSIADLEEFFSEELADLIPEE
jgi:hypothetical protein